MPTLARSQFVDAFDALGNKAYLVMRRPASDLAPSGARHLIGGLLPTVLALAGSEMLTRTIFPLPDPAPLYLLAVVYAAWRAGLRVGLLSAALTFAYALYFFSTPGPPFQYSTSGKTQLLILAIATPALALLIDRLKRRTTAPSKHARVRRLLGQPAAHYEQLEAELRASEERCAELYRELYDEAPTFYHELDAEGRILRVNRAEYATLGYSAEEMIGRPVREFICEPETAPAVNGKARYTGSAARRTYELTLRRKDGSALAALFEESPIYDERGRIVGVRAIAQDTTEHSHVVARQEGEERFRSAFDSAAMGMALVAPDGRWLEVNRALCRIVGYSKAELLRGTFQDITRPDDLELSLSHAQRLLAGEIDHYEIEKRYLHKQGQVIWALLRVALVRDRSGAPLYFSTQIQDITERKRTEAALQESHNLLYGILDGTADAIYVKDLQGRYTLANPAAAYFLGRPAEEIIGLDDTAFCSPETARQVMNYDRHIMESGEARSREVTITLNNTPRVFRTTKAPYRDHDGQIIGLIGVSHDITERQRAAELLENSQVQLRALSARMHSVREEERAHISREVHDELGQLLTGLKLDIVALTKKLADPVTRANWQPIVGRAQEITQLINEAIQTVRKISTELRPALLDAVGLTAAIEWQTHEFQKRTGIKCHLRLPTHTLNLDQDRAVALFRIFQEILTNVTRHAQASELNISLEENGADLILRAQDNGRGITAANLSNPKSLGLLGMRERALLLGGDVQIRGPQGKGTTVTVRIPRGNPTGATRE